MPRILRLPPCTNNYAHHYTTGYVVFVQVRINLQRGVDTPDNAD
ncbi:hypothetical protein FRUB_10214 [Fimbriiglobus ruber]|uniref:Uncharacterized protein n=1 Tax=Fimbriiglobus ruber TaxID=1908690 RepID=A0A225CZY1_9BACT|nr:hypothetical protein FRUB_10214 [Fimbriiglobus ruber]